MKRDDKTILMNFLFEDIQRKLSSPINDRNGRYVQNIRMTKVNDWLRRLKMVKAVGLDEFPMKFGSALVTMVQDSWQTFSIRSYVLLTKWLVSGGVTL